MIDIVNYQFKGYPVVMYGMMLVTIGALTFATVGGSVALPSLPSLTPESSSSTPVLSSPVPVAPAVTEPSVPASTPQGGKHKRRSKIQHNSKHKSNKSKKQHN